MIENEIGMSENLCPLCKKNKVDSNCTLGLDWKEGKENRGSIGCCLECFDTLQNLKVLKENIHKSIESKRYYSNLYCISSTCKFEEDIAGNFKCPRCKIEVGVLR